MINGLFSQVLSNRVLLMTYGRRLVTSFNNTNVHDLKIKQYSVSILINRFSYIKIRRE